MTRQRPIIAIDGPAGAGKSTAARRLADLLGFTYVDTGALFRAIAYLAITHELPLEDGAVIARITSSAQLSFVHDGPFRPSKLHINDLDRSREIRTPEVSRAVSKIAALPELRTVMTELMRRLGRDGGVVIEGRDIGTEVFPDAEIKIFLTASLEQRAIRHHADLVSRKIPSELGRVFEDIRQRDQQDETRAVAPLRRAEDAELLDTSTMTQEEVLDTLARIVRSRAPTSAYPRPR